MDVLVLLLSEMTVMKVRLCETVSVDVETDVDVDCHEVLSEFSRRLEQCELNNELPPYRSLMLPLVDFATKLMANIPSKAITKCRDDQRAEVVKRLQAELDRWNEIYISAE